MRKPDVVTLLLIKPDKIDWVDYITEYVERSGLEILKKEQLVLTPLQAKNFYEENEEWLIKLGKKIYSSCFQEGVNAFEKYNTSQGNYLELGMVGKKWNEEYLLLGPVIVVIIGLNGSKAKTFFADMEETVEFLRGVLCDDTYKLANDQNRAFYNGIHLARTKDEFEHQIKIIQTSWEY